jgi:hypothetical protein
MKEIERIVAMSIKTEAVLLLLMMMLLMLLVLVLMTMLTMGHLTKRSMYTLLPSGGENIGQT